MVGKSDFSLKIEDRAPRPSHLQGQRPRPALRPRRGALRPQAARGSFRASPAPAPRPSRPWASGQLTLRCPQCTSSPRGGAAGTALGLQTPGHLAGSDPAVSCVPASLRKPGAFIGPGRPEAAPGEAARGLWAVWPAGWGPGAQHLFPPDGNSSTLPFA